MKNKRMGDTVKRIIILLLVFIMLAVVLKGIVFSGKEITERNGNEYSIIMLGDSIYGNVQDETSIPSLLSEELSVSVLNGGLGGTSATLMGLQEPGQFIVDSLSLYRISEAVAQDDFSIIISALNTRGNGGLDYYENTINCLASTNFSKADIIIIEHGVNDYLVEKAIYSDSDELNPEYYYDSIRLSVLNMLKSCPDSVIILAGPVFGDEKIRAYCDAMKKVAGELSDNVIYWDTYSEGIVTKDNIENRTLDGVHLSEEGRRAYAQCLAQFIKNIKRDFEE